MRWRQIPDGQLYLNTNDLGGSLARALDANRSYYLLAYYLAGDSDYRQFRRITVRVKNHPEYIVRTAKGFLPSDIAKAADDKEKTPRQRLLQAVQAPLQRTDLRVSAAADFLETEADGAQVSLTVYLEGDNLQYREQNQRHGFSLEMLSEIYDSSGKRVESLFHNVQGNLTAERLVLARRNGYRFSWRLTLKPGVYQARVGVLETGTDYMGTATAWVEVPNLERSKLTLSSLVFQDAPARAGTTAAEGTSDALARSRVVQGIRFFRLNELCPYVFRIHLAAKAPAASTLQVQMELVQGGKLIVQDTWQPLTAGKTIHDSKGILVGGQANLAGLKPGLYELRVTVKDSQSKLAATSSAMFGIE